MIVITFLLNLLLMAAASNPHLTDRLVALYRLQTAIDVVMGVVFWGWTMRFPFASRSAWLVITGAVLLHNIQTYTRYGGMVSTRATKRIAEWFQLLNFIALPIAPFCVIWVMMTPLPSMAPWFTQNIVQIVVPWVCLTCSILGVLQSLWMVPVRHTDQVVSMLHKQSAIQFGRQGVVRPCAVARKTRDNTRYVSISVLSDVNIGSGLVEGKLHRLIEEIIHKDVELVVLLGGLVDVGYVLGSGDVGDAVEKALGGLQGRKVYVSLGAQDKNLPEGGEEAVRSAVTSLGFTLVDGGSLVEATLPDGVVVALTDDPHASTRRSGLSILLSPSPTIAPTIHTLPHDLTLTSTYLGGLINLPFNPYPLLYKTTPAAGLWSNGAARLYASPGVGSSTLCPPFPAMRCGAVAMAPLLHVEVPRQKTVA